MTTFTEVTAALRRKSLQQYGLLAGCCFFSVLLITAYVTMMRSPTVLTVLPEGGDSRKQVMMIFVLAVIGCGVFTTYASGLFFRHKSREVGIFLALGAKKGRLRGQLAGDLALLAVFSCGLGALLGTPLAAGLWQLFRIFIVDSSDMPFVFDPQAYAFALAFSMFVFAMLFVMMVRFLHRTNILDVVNEARKSEPIRAVPQHYGWLGIVLIIVGCLLGYSMPAFFILGLKWYPPEGFTGIFYLPAIVGLYMILLHTVVNGWRRGENRYKQLVSTSMMQFQGRQTVRNLLVVSVLVAGAYFGSFYTPMFSTGASMSFDARTVDYSFHYRVGQDLPVKSEIEALAQEHGVNITSFAQQPAAVLAVDGEMQVEKKTSVGITYEKVYTTLLGSSVFLSESAYNALTGASVDIAPGTIATVMDDEGQDQGRVDNEVSVVTNAVTGQTLAVTPTENLANAMLFARRVLDDSDYAAIAGDLPDDWCEEIVFFNVENVDDTYEFAKTLFHEIVQRSGPEVEVDGGWDAVEKVRNEQAGKEYWADPENLPKYGFQNVSYDEPDSSAFRLGWKYMPEFRILDKNDFVRSTAVFMMLFIFIAILCFAAVIVILFTRSLTLADTNRRVYEDLRRLGAANAYLYGTVKHQISRVFFTPVLTGTLIISFFYGLILISNDGRFSASEAMGSLNCLLVIGSVSALLYGVYRFTLARVCKTLRIHHGRKAA